MLIVNSLFGLIATHEEKLFPNISLCLHDGHQIQLRGSKLITPYGYQGGHYL